MKGARVHACLAGHPPEKSGSLVRAHYFLSSHVASRGTARDSLTPVPNPHPPTGNEGCALSRALDRATSYQDSRGPGRCVRGPRPTTVRSVQELFGDSTRGGDWAAVRLVVDGDRIVEADAPGLERDLAGLTLLEAAAVGGETLAVDALANALGPVFRAARVADARRRRDERRRRQRRRAAPLAAGRGRRDAAACGSIRRGRTPSARAARPTASSRRARRATGSASRT